MENWRWAEGREVDMVEMGWRGDARLLSDVLLNWRLAEGRPVEIPDCYPICLLTTMHNIITLSDMPNNNNNT